MPGCVRDFRYLAPQLTSALRFVRVDLPGFGGSAAKGADSTFAANARVVVEVADHLGLRDLTVLGHSMGGGTALVAASEHAHRVRRIVLVASLALRRHRGLGAPPAFFRAGGRLVLLRAVQPLLVPWLRDQYRRRGFPGSEAMGAEDFARQFRILGGIDFAGLRRLVRGPLPPALVAFARDDQRVETAVSEELARALPQAEVLAFDRGGHNLQKTRAVELGEAIRRFVAVSAQPSLNDATETQRPQRRNTKRTDARRALATKKEATEAQRHRGTEKESNGDGATETALCRPRYYSVRSLCLCVSVASFFVASARPASVFSRLPSLCPRCLCGVVWRG